MSINDSIILINNFLWGWPLVIFVSLATILITIVLGFIQFRYFIFSWKLALFPEKQTIGKADMTPFQAFINALSASLGNGSLAGMATAIYAGGPGAAFWVFVLGLLCLSLRYAEVYLSAFFGSRKSPGGIVGGPMVYLSKVPGGSWLPFAYALFCFFLSLVSGNAMQANSMRLGLVRLFNIDPLIIAIILLLFITYVMLGGAQRIIAISDRIIPIKVGVFFISATILLIYHYDKLLPALYLIINSAFSQQAVAGGIVGFSVLQAIRFSMSRSLNASEAGIGTAAVLFGGSESKQPVKDGILGMLSAFISANLVCFSIMLIIVASGVWDNGQSSIDLTISAYETAFGFLGPWLVTFLTLSFGLGVLVAYAYIGRACWLFLTNGRYLFLFNILFCVVTFVGALAKVELVWNSVDLIIAGLLTMNLFGILMLLPLIKQGLLAYEKNNE